MARRNQPGSPADSQATEPQPTDTEATDTEPQTPDGDSTAGTDEPTETGGDSTDSGDSGDSTSGDNSGNSNSGDSAGDKPEADLTAFSKAVETAVAERDTSTGEIPEAQRAPVVTEFRALDGVKAKNKAKSNLAESMKDAMNRLDITLARAYFLLQEAVSNAGSASRERTPADPTEAFVERCATLALANGLVQTTAPEGIGDDWQSKVEKLVNDSTDALRTYSTWFESDAEDKGDEPDVSSIVKAAVKLAHGKAAKPGKATSRSSSGGGGGTGERHDIAKHIAEAFADRDEGTFLTVAEIRNFKSTEYGDNPPSAGAISARLFPTSGKCTVPGIEPGKNDANHRGARKVAVAADAQAAA